jgi:stage II sporulation protein D
MSSKEVIVHRLAPNHRLATIALSLSMVFACSCARSESGAGEGGASLVPTARTNVADQDRALQEAATAALGDREGAILVMDPHSGRIRAVVNPRLAFEQAFPPGSTMKAFTALTALRAGLIDGESRSQCKGRFRKDDYQVTCSHPRSKAPFNPAQALGYSCNTYFADLASRLSPALFSATLDQFGFGKRTEVNAGGENTGSIPGQDWHIGDAVGEGKDVTVTVVQLLTAYAALLNGGHLYRPILRDAQGDAAKTAAEERATLRIDGMHRRILIKGMRGAVEYGTAAQAGLNSLRPFVFGKTGTSTASNGFRRQGWFAGFAATAGGGGDPPPEAIGLGLVVFIRRGSGAECAQVSRSIFEAYSTFADSQESARPQSSASTEPADAQLPEHLSGQSVRVSNVRERNTETLSLEEYVLGVVAAEASTEDQIEALKAQAITTRTFALKNLRRHAAEGFDFCSLTHCELYKRIDQEAGANIEKSRQAVRATEGEILRDSAGRIADAYFSASCGGVTANIESLWGVPAPSYLRGVRDDYCSAGSHSNWTERIPRARLSKALASDARSDAGRALKDIFVTERDATGRVAALSLEGERRRQLRGWEFKIIVGRTLGWNVLKSSRFEVIRSGENFIFRGRGFGHGLGLCQQGAHVMARRGMSNRQILEHYFPGAITGRHIAGSASSEAHRDATLSREMKSPSYSLVSFHSPSASLTRAESRTSSRTLTLSSEHFRVRYPASCPRQDIEAVLRTLEASRSDILGRLGRVPVAFADVAPHEVLIHATTQDFTAATGQPWWAAGATRGRKTELQPITLLRRRRVLASTLRHEYTHAVVEALGRGRTPRWLAEGLAIHVAGEAGAFKGVEPGAATVEEIERRLEHPSSAQDMRSLYAACYRAVLAIIRREGESAVWRRVSASA